MGDPTRPSAFVRFFLTLLLALCWVANAQASQMGGFARWHKEWRPMAFVASIVSNPLRGNPWIDTAKVTAKARLNTAILSRNGPVVYDEGVLMAEVHELSEWTLPATGPLQAPLLAQNQYSPYAYPPQQYPYPIPAQPYVSSPTMPPQQYAYPRPQQATLCVTGAGSCPTQQLQGSSCTCYSQYGTYFGIAR